MCDVFNRIMEDEEPSEKCPECGAEIEELWSGVRCSKCNWWECY